MSDVYSKDAVKEPASPNLESAYDILRQKNQPLNVFFSPESVAVIGATESSDSVGRTVLRNLVSHPFGGIVYPVTSSCSSVMGIKAYGDIHSVPQRVDLAIVASPSESVPGVIAECVAAGVKGAIILSAGFRECGPEGARLEQQIMDCARRGSMRIIGPNCLGVMSPLTGLNATFAGTMARQGNVAFLSQSGALCTAVLDWSLREMVGFSSFVSVGSMLDVGWGDLIDWLGDDPRTRSIVIYMESIGDARAFLSAAREVALSKPIIVIKAGRKEASARAAASHTGAMTCSDEILDAVFRRCGVLRVNEISDLFYMSEVLAKQPRPKGPRLAIVTNAGGPGVLAADSLITNGGELAELSPDTMAALNQLLPPNWSHNNPVDILGDASPERYAKSVEIIAHDPNIDGLLVILTPQALTDPTRTADHLKAYSKVDAKPVLASWMGGAAVAGGVSVLNKAAIPTFPYPDEAARAFGYMWRYSYNLRGIYETPIRAESLEENCDISLAENTIQHARRSGRTILTELEAKRILAGYGIPTVETQLAIGENEAVNVAESIGYPVVLKVHSETITHKTDAGGVQLNLHDVASVRRAYRSIEAAVCSRFGSEQFQGVTVQPMIKPDGFELIVGSSLDEQFGPVLLFGAGGRLVETYNDRAIALPPLNTTLARRMMEQTRVFTALRSGSGGRAVDRTALEQLLVQFSRLVLDQVWVREIEINPLLISKDGLHVLDARIALQGPNVTRESIPKPVIRPYPSEYTYYWNMKDGSPVTIRPIRPEDEPMMVKFHETLSDRSVYLRYFHPMRLTQRVAHERLVRMCFIDFERELALVAVRRDPKTHLSELLGVGRLIKLHGCNDAEFAILVSDSCQRQGLGTELLGRLVLIGRVEKLSRIVGDILPDNRGMLLICERLGFARRYSPMSGVVKAEIEL